VNPVPERAEGAGVAANLHHHDLKRRAAHGALVSTVAQAGALVLRTGSTMLLARLLLPADYGLVGMVTAFTGFLGLFRDGGLSMASVQRDSITPAQSSTLFWVNVAVGVLLALLCAALAPVLAVFYGEPRLVWVTVVSGISFLFNGAGAQHRAMLQRTMRFITLSVIDTAGLVLSVALGIGLAVAGGTYWALVVMAVTPPIVSTLGVWLATGWIPGLPQRRSGIGSMLWFGGTLTLNSVVIYMAYNMEKVLLGRYWGAETLGIYGRAYQLINLPTETLNQTIGSVAFSALSRVQNDAVRLKSYFLKGYGLLLSLVIPIAMACVLFANDLIRVFLGAKWHESAPVFRLLAPTVVAVAMMNPLGSLLLATGRVVRNFNLALLITPVVIVGYVIGLRHGPQGVATGYSIAMTLLVVPVLLWAKHGLPITGMDILTTLKPPFVSVLIGTAGMLAAASLVDRIQPVFLRLVVESSLFLGVYAIVLLFGMKQKTLYMSIVRETGLWPISAWRQRAFRTESAEVT
jgi:PST family polysaccharide transporter